MKTSFLVFASLVSVFATSLAGAAILTCDVSVTNKKTSETKAVPLSLDVTGKEGATNPLALFTLGQYNFSAWVLAGQIVISGEDPVSHDRLSSTGQGTANFRLEAEAGIVEAICNLK